MPRRRRRPRGVRALPVKVRPRVQPPLVGRRPAKLPQVDKAGKAGEVGAVAARHAAVAVEGAVAV